MLKRFFQWRRHLDAIAAALSVLIALYMTLLTDNSHATLILWWSAAAFSVLSYFFDPAGRMMRRLSRSDRLKTR
ncbi:hypothetical protein [Vreelandella massiliensis]|uniref:hypothetical protein n=1 Tax=Vreelandella massiliensis TaxID=1816686 RepID=UPI00096ABF07|nr:hypothetical protein [Halomonas massiliensis]